MGLISSRFMELWKQETLKTASKTGGAIVQERELAAFVENVKKLRALGEAKIWSSAPGSQHNVGPKR